MLTGSSARGAVYDRGYRPYAGPLGGRRHARWALFRLTVRRALGIRRSWRQKVLPWTLLAVAVVPAIVNVGIGYVLTRDTSIQELAADGDFEFFTYREYIELSLVVLLLFLAVTAPDAVCPDRRNRVLPLLFSRPLVGLDYALAKVAAIAVVIFGFSFLPQVALFIGQAVVFPDGSWEYVSDNADIMWKVPAAVAVMAFFFAVVGVALASLTDRRMVGGITILGVALVTAALAGLLVGDVFYEDGSLFGLLDVFGLPLHIRDVIFLGHVDPEGALGGVSGAGTLAVIAYLGVLALCCAVLFWRYEEVDL